MYKHVTWWKTGLRQKQEHYLYSVSLCPPPSLTEAYLCRADWEVTGREPWTGEITSSVSSSGDFISSQSASRCYDSALCSALAVSSTWLSKHTSLEVVWLKGNDSNVWDRGDQSDSTPLKSRHSLRMLRSRSFDGATRKKKKNRKERKMKLRRNHRELFCF